MFIITVHTYWKNSSTDSFQGSAVNDKHSQASGALVGSHSRHPTSSQMRYPFLFLICTVGSTIEPTYRVALKMKQVRANKVYISSLQMSLFFPWRNHHCWQIGMCPFRASSTDLLIRICTSKVGSDVGITRVAFSVLQHVTPLIVGQGRYTLKIAEPYALRGLHHYVTLP